MRIADERLCLTEQVQRAVAEALGSLPGRSIVDVGGTGMLRDYLSGEYTVTDANIRDGIDGCDLPFADDAFDVGVSKCTLEHVEPRRRSLFLDELIRVSSAGVILCYPVDFEAVDRIKREAFGHAHPTRGDIRRGDVERHLAGAGLRVESRPIVSRLTHLLGIHAWRCRAESPMLYDYFREQLEREAPTLDNAYLILTVGAVS